MDQATEYGGRTLQQFSNYEVTISMNRYLQQKAREITLQKGRLKIPLAQADDTEITAMRGLNGKLQWAAREGMPHASGDASILAATMPTPTVKDISEANACLRRLLQNPGFYHHCPYTTRQA